MCRLELARCSFALPGRFFLLARGSLLLLLLLSRSFVSFCRRCFSLGSFNNCSRNIYPFQNGQFSRIALALGANANDTGVTTTTIFERRCDFIKQDVNDILALTIFFTGRFGFVLAL